MPAREGVRIEGLTEFTRELRAAHRNLPKIMTATNRIAANIILPEARARAGSVGGVAAHAAKRLRVFAQQRKAGLQMADPTAFGAEFGGGVYAKQFKPHLGRVGYFLYPAIRAKAPEVVEAYADAFDQGVVRAFPD